MRFSKEMDQALRSLGYMGREGRSLTAREISLNQKIPFEKLSKILQKLSSARVVTARKGRQGGYVLNRPLGELNLLELHLALGESPSVVPCSQGSDCGFEGKCAIRKGLGHFQNDLNRLLKEYSIADITGEALW